MNTVDIQKLMKRGQQNRRKFIIKSTFVFMSLILMAGFILTVIYQLRTESENWTVVFRSEDEIVIFNSDAICIILSLITIVLLSILLYYTVYFIKTLKRFNKSGNHIKVFQRGNALTVQFSFKKKGMPKTDNKSPNKINTVNIKPEEHGN